MTLKLPYDCLAFIASSFRVTEEDRLSETDLSGPPSFFLMFSLLFKELIFIFYLIRLHRAGAVNRLNSSFLDDDHSATLTKFRLSANRKCEDSIETNTDNRQRREQHQKYPQWNGKWNFISVPMLFKIDMMRLKSYLITIN